MALAGLRCGGISRWLNRPLLKTPLPKAPVPVRPVVSPRVSTREEASQADASAPVALEACYDSSLPFQAAVLRLQELLRTTSWDSDEEMLRYDVANLVPEMKLTLFSNLGSILTLAAFVTSWVTGEDPLGGFAMTDDSLAATAAGAGYALPLILCSVVSRLSSVRHSFPVLDDLQDSQSEIVQPIVRDLNPSQLLILASVVVVPSMLMLLPAFHGALTVAGQIVTADLMQPMGVHLHLHLPDGLRRQAGVLLPAVCSAYFAAWVVTRQLDVQDRQVVVIREAFQTADRYFLHEAAARAAERPDLLRQRPTAEGQQQHQHQQPSSYPSHTAAAKHQQHQQPWVPPTDAPLTSFASVGDAALTPAAAAAAAEGEGDAGALNGPLRQLGAEMSEAFKTVSVLWLLTRRRAARLAYVLTALNVCYFGIIWHQTRDLATPVTAALLATLTELFLIKHLPRGRGGSGGNGSDSNGRDSSK